MPFILDLPIELLLNITEHLQANDPFDIESLALCCKETMTKLGTQIIAHQESRRKFSNIVLGWYGRVRREDGSMHKSNVHPIVDLKDMLLDDKARLYVQTAIIDHIDEDYWEQATNASDSEEEKDASVDKVVNEIQVKIRAKVAEVCQVIFSDDPSGVAETWSLRITEGDAGAAVALILAICPHWRKLDINYIYQKWHKESRDILTAMTAAAMSPNTNKLGIFKRLSEVHLHGSENDDDMKVDGHMLSHFMALPKIRILDCGWVDGQGISWPYSQGISNLTNLTLHASDLDTRTLTDHLLGIKGVETFHYTYLMKSTLAYSNWEPSLVTEALRQSAAHSLVELDLIDYECTGDICSNSQNAFLGSLRQFQKLTDLRVDFVMLFERGRPQKLGDFLPASLEEIIIRLGSETGGLMEFEMGALFEALFEDHGKLLPNLFTVIIEHKSLLDQKAKKAVDELCRLCIESGVSMEVEQDE